MIKKSTSSIRIKEDYYYLMKLFHILIAATINLKSFTKRIHFIHRKYEFNQYIYDEKSIRCSYSSKSIMLSGFTFKYLGISNSCSRICLSRFHNRPLAKVISHSNGISNFVEFNVSTALISSFEQEWNHVPWYLCGRYWVKFS